MGKGSKKRSGGGKGKQGKGGGGRHKKQKDDSGVVAKKKVPGNPFPVPVGTHIWPATHVASYWRRSTIHKVDFQALFSPGTDESREHLLLQLCNAGTLRDWCSHTCTLHCMEVESIQSLNQLFRH